MFIRPLKIQDESQVVALMENFLFLTKKEVLFNAAECLNDSNVHGLVIEDNGNVVGHGALVVSRIPSKGLYGIVHDVVVSDQYRGQGLGRKLVNELVDLARSLKLPLIVLTSNKARVAARNLYESIGFVEKDTGFFEMVL
ncbi:MAG TPA: GNAT family N-acetyltransferase [Candidatus Paceibacterota bacterium]|nr:GNAT family N-acetyltransferase [Candidatus Paceibacterota bacterium]